MKIYLFGLLGSGKKELGKRISLSIKLRFVHLDSEIENREGMKISKIMKLKGRDHFRKVESIALRNLSAEDDFIMVVGGGTPCFQDNIKFMNQTGISIFLNTPISDIIKNLSVMRKNSEFSVIDDNHLEKLNLLLRKRLPYYKQATFTFTNAHVTAWDVLQLVYKKQN